MRKATDCVTKAVKAKKQCEKKTNLLVYKKERKSRKRCDNSYVVAPECAKHAKRIRVCTGAQMKKMCAPKPCPCPTRSSSASSGILGPIKFALKAALAGALVFLTVDIGMWGDPETTESLYYSIYKTILPKTCKDEDEEPPSESFLDRGQHKEVCEAYQGLMDVPIPRKKDEQCTPPCPETNEKLTFLMQNKWNQIINCAFNCVLSLPSTIASKLSGETTTDEDEEEEEIDECED